MMRQLRTLVLGATALAVTGAFATHLGADRQLDRLSPFVRGIEDRPLPDDWREIEILANVMSLAHDPAAARGLLVVVELEALSEILGEPAPPRPAKAEYAIREGAAQEKQLRDLRQRVLAATPIAAAPIVDHDPSLEPKIHGFHYLHDGGSIWTRDDGGTQRELGVKVSNTGAREVRGGEFTLQFGPDRKPLRFECRYNVAIAPGASQAMLCQGERFPPIAEVMRAIATVPPVASHRKVAYELRGARYEVRPHEAGYVDPIRRAQVEALAMERIVKLPCKARGACAAEVSEGLAARPAIQGFLGGLLAGGIVMFVGWAWGRRAALAVGTGIAVVVGVVCALGVAWAAAFGLQEHVLYALLFAGVAGKHALALGVGFAFGMALPVFAWEMAQGARRWGAGSR